MELSGARGAAAAGALRRNGPPAAAPLAAPSKAAAGRGSSTTSLPSTLHTNTKDTCCAGVNQPHTPAEQEQSTRLLVGSGKAQRLVGHRVSAVVMAPGSQVVLRWAALLVLPRAGRRV